MASVGGTYELAHGRVEHFELLVRRLLVGLERAWVGRLGHLDAAARDARLYLEGRDPALRQKVSDEKPLDLFVAGVGLGTLVRRGVLRASRTRRARLRGL